MWWLQSILELTIEETRSCSETSQSKYSDRVSIDKHLLSSINSNPRRWSDLFRADLSPKFHIITRLPLADSYLIFMCSTIILGNTHFLIFYYLQQTVWGSSEIWREDSRLVQSFILELHWFLNLILCIIFRLLLCSTLVCLSSYLC